MNSMIKAIAVSAAILLSAGCAHNIKITPANAAAAEKMTKSEKSVGFYVSEADKAKKTKTPGGGGDSITYHLEKDLEFPVYQVLQEKFASVKALNSGALSEEDKSAGLTMVFTPTFSSTSSGSSLLIWPADKFAITMMCKVMDHNGNVVLEKELKGEGAATNSELMGNFALAANRATDNLLSALRRELEENAAFK